MVTAAYYMKDKDAAGAIGSETEKIMASVKVEK